MFYLIFLIPFLWGIIHCGHSTNFEALDAKVEALIRPEGPSQLLRPAYAPVALRVVHNQKGGNQIVGEFGGRWKGQIPHPRFASGRVMENRLFPKTPGCALTTFFFPTDEDGLAPNTISRNDPVGKLNQGRNDQAMWGKMSGRLGDIVATVHEMLLAGPDTFSEEDAAHKLLSALDQKHMDLFAAISRDKFSQYELLLALREAFDQFRDYVGGLPPQEAKESIEQEKDPILKEMILKFLAGSELTIKDFYLIPEVGISYSAVVSDDVLVEFVRSGGEKLDGIKINDKKLMALRKRNLAYLLAETIKNDLRSGTLYPVSLSTLMSYAWKTRGEGLGLDVFYAHALRIPQMQLADVLQPISTSDLMKMLTTLKAMEHPTISDIPFARQMALLEMDDGVQDIRLPGSGMATAGGLNYSVCVESMILDALIHACRHPVTKEIAFDKLPLGLTRNYFDAYRHDLFSQAARDAWAELTRQVPGVIRVDGGRGLEPSFRNVMLVYQFLMEGKGLEIQPVRTQEAYETAVAQYEEFLDKFSLWLSQNLGWKIMFLADDTQWIDGRRILGSIDLKTEVEGYDMFLGTLYIDPGHAHYEVNISSTQELDEDQKLINLLPVTEFRLPYAVYLTSMKTLKAIANAHGGDNYWLPHLDIFPQTPDFARQLFLDFMKNPTPEKITYFEGLASKVQLPNYFYGVLISDRDMIKALKNDKHPRRPVHIQLLERMMGESVNAFDCLTTGEIDCMTLMEMADSLGLRQKMQQQVFPHVKNLSLKDMYSVHNLSFRWATILPHMPQLELIRLDSVLKKMQEADDQAAVEVDLLALKGVPSLKQICLTDAPEQLASDAFKRLVSFMPENIILEVAVSAEAVVSEPDHKALGQDIRMFVRETRPDIKLELGSGLGDNEPGVITDRPTDADLAAAGDV